MLALQTLSPLSSTVLEPVRHTFRGAQFVFKKKSLSLDPECEMQAKMVGGTYEVNCTKFMKKCVEKLKKERKRQRKMKSSLAASLEHASESSSPKHQILILKKAPLRNFGGPPAFIDQLTHEQDRISTILNEIKHSKNHGISLALRGRLPLNLPTELPRLNGVTHNTISQFRREPRSTLRLKKNSSHAIRSIDPWDGDEDELNADF